MDYLFCHTYFKIKYHEYDKQNFTKISSFQRNIEIWRKKFHQLKKFVKFLHFLFSRATVHPTYRTVCPRYRPTRDKA